MTVYTVTAEVVGLFDEPKEGAAFSAGALIRGETVEELPTEVPDGWLKVQTLAPPPVRVGFLPKSAVTILNPAGEEIDKKRFFQALSLAARIFGADHFYLFALANLESNIRNIPGPSGDSVFGPFQFSKAKWSDLVAKYGADQAIGIADRTNPFKQVIFAALYVQDVTESLMNRLGRLPRYNELYLVHLLGDTGGAVMVEAAQKSGGMGVDKILATVVPAETAARFVAANPSILQVGNKTASVTEALANAAAKLEPGLREAKTLSDELDPKELQKPAEGTPTSQSGDPPWLTQALTQLGTAEDQTPGGSNKEVEKYFTATQLAGAKDDVPWCAAFLAWCTKNCGDAKAAASVDQLPNPALAFDWLNWGRPLETPVRGSIAVLSESHVGIVTAVSPTGFTLLAGNQKDSTGNDSVNEAKFMKGSARGFRWLDV